MYSNQTEQYISNEFPCMRDTCYLDHAGATLYAKSQINKVFKELSETIFGNPHSLNLSSRHTTDVIDQVRYRILKHFHTDPDDYSVIFTSGATAALKLLGESFKWKEVSKVDPECVYKPTQCTSRCLESNVCDSDVLSSKTCCSEFKPPLGRASRKENCGAFVYLQDNHTSVLGLRELADGKGACVHCIPHDLAFSLFGKTSTIPQKPNQISNTNSLFIYPAQSNFSGVKYPLHWISKVQSGLLHCGNSNSCCNSKWYCCLDAASYVSTSDLNLSDVKPDFVCISFYKIFGYPTGIGALLVRNSSAHTLERNYFGGGTVQISMSTEKFHIPRTNLSDRFEDGTISFLSIVALRHGFDTLQSLTKGMDNVSLHTLFLSRYVHHNLLFMHHNNRTPAVVLYSDTDYEDKSTQGNIVNFNLLRSSGEFIGFAEVLHMANLWGIHLRTGCFCNPGACQRHLNLSNIEIKGHFEAGHVCGDELDLIGSRPTGSIRISFGYMSTMQEADKFLDMIKNCFIEAPVVMYEPQWWSNFQRKYRDRFALRCDSNIPTFSIEKSNGKNNTFNVVKDQTFSRNEVNEIIVHENETQKPEVVPNKEYLGTRVNQLNETLITAHAGENKESYYLKNIYVYPVKSCSPMAVNSWKINSKGLQYDREWMIVGPSGVALTQKQETKLCLIVPKIDVDHENLTLNFEGLSPMYVPLNQPYTDLKNEKTISLCESKVCGDHIQGWDCGDEVAEWLCNALGREGLRLLRQASSKLRISKPKSKCQTMGKYKQLAEISLANQAQFLLVNTASIHWLESQLMDINMDMENLIARFRSNFVVRGENAFEENDWAKLKIGHIELRVEGPCPRCQMVCIDQKTGERTKEPLQSLAAAFHGKMRFGIYLQILGEGTKVVNVGDPVSIIYQ